MSGHHHFEWVGNPENPSPAKSAHSDSALLRRMSRLLFPSDTTKKKRRKILIIDKIDVAVADDLQVYGSIV
jgi:hypothetical protein